MTRIAPSPQTMERMEPNWGTDSFHDMSDGWKIHCETWHPDSAPRAVWLHGHGWNESTMTLGTRRLVHACKSRGIVFVAHDLHMHGLSLKQNGVEYPEVMRSSHQGANVIARHYVELSKALVAQYSLPLIVSSHSASAVAHIMATAALVQVCKDAGVPLACQLYLAPTPSGLSPARVVPGLLLRTVVRQVLLCLHLLREGHRRARARQSRLDARITRPERDLSSDQ